VFRAVLSGTTSSIRVVSFVVILQLIANNVHRLYAQNAWLITTSSIILVFRAVLSGTTSPIRVVSFVVILQLIANNVHRVYAQNAWLITTSSIRLVFRAVLSGTSSIRFVSLVHRPIEIV
jgi:general stress protein CsbA